MDDAATVLLRVQGATLGQSTTLTAGGIANRDLRWLEEEAEVEVTDGELTLSQGPGARRNKLCFVEIRIP